MLFYFAIKTASLCYWCEMFQIHVNFKYLDLDIYSNCYVIGLMQNVYLEYRLLWIKASIKYAVFNTFAYAS